MANESSFDVVSRVSLPEVDNAIQMSMREVGTRFDFKGSRCQVERAEATLTLHADDEFKLKALTQVLEEKLVKRRVSLRALTYERVEPAASGTVRQAATLQTGIPIEKAREIVKHVKATGLRVQAQIQEAQVRVTGKSKDDLQAVMAHLRAQDLGIDLQFENYR